MEYKNPILMADFSDPDVIRVGDDFYMVASSFNHLPGIPILHSKNLVDWKIINYVYDKLPFEAHNKVIHGGGAWAPSIRYHNNKFYCIIPFIDYGIYVSEVDNPYNKWSDLWCLIDKPGIEDPCPIWLDDKCYLAVGFAKSRIGFNSCIGIYEVSSDLRKNISGDYKIIYDGHNDNPTIEGPKFNVRNGYIYIMCPAGSVKGGWQTALRSKNIYGPYESKIVLMQGDTLVNGPHQGALIDINENDEWSFIHFQDMRAYGRIVHLQPVKWYNDWPIIGNATDLLLPGTPVFSYEYPINTKSSFKIPLKDEFKGNNLSLLWQRPSNINDFYYVNDGLYLKCLKSNKDLNELEYMLFQKTLHKEFDVKTIIDLSNLSDGDEIGFYMFGQKYSYLAIINEKNKLYIELRSGQFNNNDIVIDKLLYNDTIIELNLKARNSNIYDLDYQLGFNKKYFKNKFKAYAGRWVGSRIGVYSKSKNESNGYGIINSFEIKKK